MSGRRKRARMPKPAADILGPTAEQAEAFALGDVVDRSSGTATKIGKAYHRVRMVETLERRGVITGEMARVLKDYRHYADIADRSPVRDSLNMHRSGGDGAGPTIAKLHAERMVNAFEDAAGRLRHLLRQVVVDDVSLSHVAIARGGSIDDCRYIAGQRICTIRPRSNVLAAVQLEFRMAACRLLGEEAAACAG